MFNIAWAGSEPVDHHHELFPCGGLLLRGLLISDLVSEFGSSSAAGFLT